MIRIRCTVLTQIANLSLQLKVLKRRLSALFARRMLANYVKVLGIKESHAITTQKKDSIQT
jgi:hypothetical protein